MTQRDQVITATINININPAPDLVEKLNAILAKLGIIAQKESEMAVDLTNLRTTVTAIKGVDDSAVALIIGLAAKIQELINASGNTVDPAELQAIVDQMNADSQPLADAVAANPVP